MSIVIPHQTKHSLLLDTNFSVLEVRGSVEGSSPEGARQLIQFITRSTMTKTGQTMATNNSFDFVCQSPEPLIVLGIDLSNTYAAVVVDNVEPAVREPSIDSN
ncbi:hypothetical protein CKO50_17050 [Pseudoalteromonas sp. HM-SA03]|uniref:hypothetical protein n=1 Tax=unclassified Pseudoalteromonas TaxID=194690 RepID=UPI000BADE640|nr:MULTISPECIES: hypothetical protein [unclassified Pseudoalteromonas]MCG9761843.1 hypothetical protein [Pseudoalteromonas sp. Isolate6]PAY00132.1 hypothetical protein CKO50_17050 [Pseudoalteromonas sp. HM-SA03]